MLDALREELRKRNYLPILFDFSVPAARDITETVTLLACMAHFIIADLTDPSSIPKELEAIVPHLAVPVQPLLEGSSGPYAMFKDYWKYEWVLSTGTGPRAFSCVHVSPPGPVPRVSPSRRAGAWRSKRGTVKRVLTCARK